MSYLVALALAVGFGVPVAVLSAAMAQGKAGAAAVESIARQPEAAGDIRASMILALALIESLVIYSLIMAILLWIKLPGKAPELMEILRGVGGG
ncbi:MAG: ATP synthase F0 subunit C [Armatimonadota bacterium]